jgi:integrase
VETITKAGRHFDRDNLWLQVQASGAKSWLFVYMRNRKQHYMGLGTAKVGSALKGLTLAEAREAAADAHRLLRAGVDPLEAKRARRPTKAVVTFREVAEQFIETKAAGWRNEKTPEQFRSSLSRYAYPTIGSLPVEAVTANDVVAILTPVWSRAPVMAAHVRNNLAMVFDAAKARGLRSGDNPAAWKGGLAHILPAAERVRRPEHHAALPYKELPGFMKELRKRDSVAALALQWTVLTAARTSETINARWSDIDAKARLWTVPGERMKSGRPHRVPLSDEALAILQKLPREDDNPYLFVGGRRAKPISNMAMLKLIGQLRPGVTVHGMRAAFRTWCSDRGEQREVAEAALAHVLGDMTERAYARSDMFDKRKALMKRWAAFLR